MGCQFVEALLLRLYRHLCEEVEQENNQFKRRAQTILQYSEMDVTRYAGREDFGFECDQKRNLGALCCEERSLWPKQTHSHNLFEATMIAQEKQVDFLPEALAKSFCAARELISSERLAIINVFL